MKKILVTGAFGQIGSELVPALQKKFGKDNIIAFGHKNVPGEFDGILETGDARDKELLESLIKKYDIGEVYHLVSLLSVNGEIDPSITWDINMNSLKHVLDLGVKYKLKIFWPSSIAVFGPSTPRENTPEHTVLEPTTIYGVTKNAGEALCRYYNIKYGLDVRSVRYPGILSWKTPPGQGTTEYAIEIFYEGLKSGKYTCFLKEDTKLPMMYVNDSIKATIDIMQAPFEKIEVRNSYNLSALSFTAGELAEEAKKHIPGLQVDYKPDKRQRIADTWPRTIDDSEAKEDWGWEPEYDLPKMVEEMVTNLKEKFGTK